MGRALAFPVVGVPVVVEVFFEAADATADVVADGGVDDVAAGAVQEVEEVGEELGDGFVFAGLAGHDEEDFVAAVVVDAVDDGAGGVELVGVEGGLEDVAGEGSMSRRMWRVAAATFGGFWISDFGCGLIIDPCQGRWRAG